MIRTGVYTLEFLEADLKTPLPDCLEVVAAALMSGFRLLPKPDVNHEDILTGCKRLEQFRDARAARLQRVIRFHFIGRPRSVLGQQMTVEQFCQAWNEDAAFQRALRGREPYAAWLLKLQTLISQAGRSVCAMEGSRVAYGKIHGDKLPLAAMASYMENGGIR